MNINIKDYTVANWYDEKVQHKCGYCKNPHGSVTYGMWVETMTVEDYQDLIDRGWRRSGKYCYKPIMNETCCPQYTIRCLAPEFQLTKSQKKVIKKLNKFLVDGTVQLENSNNKSISNEESVNDIFIKESNNITIDKKILKSSVESDQENDIMVPVSGSTSKYQDQQSSYGEVQSKDLSGIPIENNSKDRKGTFKEGEGIDLTKPRCKKAKQLRLERKKDKLLKRGMSLEKICNDNEQKSLEQFIDDVAGKSKHKLTIKLIPTSPPSGEWENVKNIELQLYSKYQITIHNDPPEKITLRSFERFLVLSPLQIRYERLSKNSPSFSASAKLFEKYQIRIHNEQLEECDEQQFLSFLVDSPIKPARFPNDTAEHGYGSFHQQYWIDDTLIAVGVIDILPKCVSSVYFFYDPDYRNLSLGTYGSLRELYFTRTLNALVPSLNYYYMGYYIHSCPKMLYKGKLTPSYLLCPETYKWFKIETCLPKLDSFKYSRLQDDPNDVDLEASESKDIDLIKIWLYSRQELTQFKFYKKRFSEENLFKNIGHLIGKNMCKRIIILM